MKNSRNERLSEHLLNVDEEILTNAYEVDSCQKLQSYIKTKNARNKKHLHVTSIFHKTTIFAACLLFIIGIVLCVPFLFSSNTSKLGHFFTSGKNIDNTSVKAPYIVADSDDTYGLELEDLKSRDEKYISDALQKKMQTYGSNAIYRVIVEIIITTEDYNEFQPNDDELLLLFNHKCKAFENYEKALASLSGIDDENKRAELIEEINAKEEIARELQRKYDECLRKLEDEHYGNIANMRLEYASKLSETSPVLISEDSNIFIYSAYKSQYAYFMDLTEDDINELAKRGGYVFRLASSPKDTVPQLEQE